MTTAILIVSHNTRDDLRACLESLLDSGAPEHDLFVADNASTDGTVPMLEEAFPQVRRVCLTSNLMYAEATNLLWSLSESDWALLLNPDVRCRYHDIVTLPDKWHPDLRCAAVAPQCRYPDGRIQSTCRRLPDALTVWREVFAALAGSVSRWKMADFDHRHARKVEQPMFSCLWIRRSAWQTVGELDTHYPLFFNDVDWCRRAKNLGFDIQFDPSVAVLHQLGGTTSKYPLRKLWQSNRSLARYILRTSASRPSQWVGLLGVALSFAARLPWTLRRTLPRASSSI